MDTDTLCTLLAQRIPSEQFQLWGLDIHWMSEEYDTPENNAIVADVIANYTTLEAAYLAEQQAIADAEEARQAAKAQAIIDNLPSWSEVEATIGNIANLANAKVFIAKLARVVYWLAKDQAD